MGNRKKTSYWLAAFFCGIGSVYAGPVIADDTAEDPGSAPPPSSPDFHTNNVAKTADTGLPTDDGSTPDGDPILLFGDQEDDTALPQGQTVNVGSFGEIDLHVKDLDLTKVLQLLSIQSQRNIIASRNVAGKVSADLYGVDFYEAMDAILATNGFGFEEKGNFIYVYTADEIKQREEARRAVVTKVIRLNYLTATDAGAFLQPMLSSAGSLSLSGESGEGFEPTLSNAGADSNAFEATLIVRDYPENVEEMEKIVENLDVRPKQVLIESMILTASLTENNEFGVDFSIFTDVNISDFVTPLGAVDQLIGGAAGSLGSGQVVTSAVGNTIAPGGFKVGIFNDDFALFVRALDSVTDTTVLAKPQLLVLNRQKANLLVGQRLGYLSSTSTDTSTTQTVEFLDIGTQLTVRPFISTDDFIRLEVRPSVSDGSTSIQAGSIIPNTTTNEMISNVMVRSGQTVVLGGFFKEGNDITRRQIPGGGDIPVLGYLFKGQEDEMKRDEVIFMLRPTVMKDHDLAIQADSATHGAELAVLGSRDRLLPWSHQRLVSSALTNAREHMENGQTDKALWDADVALYLDPASVEAMQIKEELTGERYYYAEDSILTGSVDDMIDSQTQELTVTEPMTDAAGEQAIDKTDAPATEAATAETTVAQPEALEAEATVETAEATDAQAKATTIVEVGAFDTEPEAQAVDSQWFEPATEAKATTDPADADTVTEAPADQTASGDQFGWFEESVEGTTAEPGFNENATAEADAQIDAFLEAEASADQGQPVNIFDFVNSEVSGDESADVMDDTKATYEVVEVDPASIEDVD